jgi:multiple sugar transport system substrate-binding protein
MQAALPIDAACHVSCWRSDLLERFGAPIPNSWDQAITLANETGKVALPLTRTAVWGILIDFCANLGEPPMKSQSFVFNRDLALDAWARIQKLVKMVPDWCFDSSPVAFLKRMSCGDEIAYCPLTYGYSTYSMRGYAPARISFGDIRLFDGRSPAGAVLGGAGVGISVNCQEPQLAAKHIEWLTSNEVQAGLYAQFGGQPAAASAWTDDETDALSGGFLSATVASMSNCYHRPNVPGFHEFQTRSAYALQSALRVGRSVQGVLDGIDEDWRATFCSS